MQLHKDEISDPRIVKAHGRLSTRLKCKGAYEITARNKAD